MTATTTSSIDASTIIESDSAPGVLVTAVLRRATTGNSWDDPNRFNSFCVVGRLGRADANGFITLGAGRALTDAERAANEAALAPGTVEWMDSRARCHRRTSYGDDPRGPCHHRDGRADD